MNISSMHNKFKNDVDKLDTQSLPDLLPEQIDLALNDAQIIFVKSRSDRNNLQQQGFQENQRRTDELNPLIKTTEIIPTLIQNGFPKIYKVSLNPLPDGNTYMRYEKGLVQTSSAKCAAKYVKPTESQIDDIDVVCEDPFNRPILSRPVITFEDGGIYVYADSTFNVNKFKLTYMKKPVEMSIFDNISCELPEFVHDEIVAIAVNMTLEKLESQRLSTSIVMDSKRE